MTHLGRYAIVRKIATGGMAEVYLGRIEGLSDFRKRVVVKRILPQLAGVPEFVEMFLKEARLAALLEHPNLVAVFDLGADDGSFHLVMEYVDGTSLLALIHAAQAHHEFLPLDRAIWIVTQVLEGLSYLHALPDEHGHPLALIHRDVSPENVLLAKSGGVKLADFGLVKAANHPSVTQTGAFKGKLHYLAPEMVHTSDFDQRVDLFSAGVVLFEAVTNSKPFSGPTPNDVLDAVLHRTPTPVAQLRPGVPPLLQTIVDRALSKDPSERYANARAMQHDLDLVLRELHSRTGPAELAALIDHLRPLKAARTGEPTLTPQNNPGTAPTRPPSQRTPSVAPGPSMYDTAPPGGLPFAPAPPSPTAAAASNSKTVRGLPAFSARPDVERGAMGDDATRIRRAPEAPSAPGAQPARPRTNRGRPTKADLPAVDPDAEGPNPARPKRR